MANYKYPYDLKRQLPELVDILNAMARADAQEERARDIRPLMALLMRLPAVDPSLPMDKPVAALASTPWSITPTRKEFADTAEIATHRLRTAIDEVLESWMETRYYGKWCAEVTWKQQNWSTETSNTTTPLWTPKIVRPLEQTEFEANAEYEREIALLADPKSTVRTELSDNVDTSHLVDTFRVGTPGGVFRSILIPQWLMYMNTQDTRNMLKRIRGLILATYKDGGSGIGSKQQAKAEKAVREAGKVNWAAVSDNVKFEFVKLVDAMGAEAHQNFDKALQAKAAIALCGTADGSQLGDKGSRAAVETMVYGVEESLAFLNRKKCARVINEQLIRQDIERNYTDGSNANQTPPYRFEFQPRYSEDRESNARIATMFLESGLPLYASEITEKTGFTPATDDEIVKPKAQTL